MGHLKDSNTSYFKHLFTAWKLAFTFFIGSIRCLMHGIIPEIDIECARNTVSKANNVLIGPNEVLE